MHSQVFSSILLAAAVVYAAPAAPSVSSVSSVTAAKSSSSASTTYAPTTTSSSAKASYTADSALPTPKYEGKPTTTGKVDAPTGGDVGELAIPAVVQYNTRAGNQALITSLLNAPTQGDRARLLDQPGDFVFDFNESPEGSESNGKGGHTVAATAKTFPALIGNNAAMTLGFLGPCAMNTPHVHPRSTELNVIVEGRLVTNFIQENGVSSVENVLSKYQMTVFPQGALHQEFNPDCEPSVFVAGFGHVDPGVQQAAQSFFGLRPDVVAATLGGVSTIDGADLESFRDHIPANVALGVEQCLQKCGIKRNAKRDINEIIGA